MRKSKKIVEPAVTVDAEVTTTYYYDQCAFCTHIRRDHSFGQCKDCQKCDGFMEPSGSVVLQGDAYPGLKK